MTKSMSLATKFLCGSLASFTNVVARIWRTTQKKILCYLHNYPKATRKDVAEALGNITEDGVKFNIGLLQQYEALKRKGRPVALFARVQAVLFVLGSPDMHVSVSSGCTLSRHSVCVCGCSL